MVHHTTASVTDPDQQPLSAYDDAQAGGLMFESRSEHERVFIASYAV